MMVTLFKDLVSFLLSLTSLIFKEEILKNIFSSYIVTIANGPSDLILKLQLSICALFGILMLKVSKSKEENSSLCSLKGFNNRVLTYISVFLIIVPSFLYTVKSLYNSEMVGFYLLELADCYLAIILFFILRIVINKIPFNCKCLIINDSVSDFSN